MCTITWMIDSPQSYHVFFNRDESRQRSRAEPPAKLNFGSMDAVAPVDPDGGGTWLAVNQRGATFALLNYYQAENPDADTSRGGVIPALIESTSVDDVAHRLRQLPLNQFNGFSLLCFLPSTWDEGAEAGRSIPMFRWDGKQLSCHNQTCPVISSSVEYDAVAASRTEFYRQQLAKLSVPPRPMDFYRYHATHYPERGHASVCMHRDDAHTVSFSHVSVGPHVIAFNYLDGSPCSGVSAGVEQGKNLRTVTLLRQRD